MSARKNLRLFTLVALLALFALPGASYVGQLFGNNSLFPGVHPVNASPTTTTLGFDCAYGSQVETVGATFPTSVTTDAPYLVPDFDGTLDTSCKATYLADSDGALHPLVSDNPTGLSGGGITIDVVASLNSTTTINGFDISVQYDPKVLNAVIIDQSGLIWGGAGLPTGAFILTLAKTINQAAGQVRVAQVVVGAPPVTGAAELFRVRFDIVGASTGSPITLFSDVLTNPGSVVHNDLNLNGPGLDTTSIYNALNGGAVLNPAASWTFSPSPEIPGSPLTFTATATCPGCTGALTYSWDFSALDSTPPPLPVQASGSTATITAPPPVVNRVVLTITDAATPTAHSMAITRVLPLALVESPSLSTLSVGVAGPTGGFTGKWLGGVVTSTAGYSGSWRFCPGSALSTGVCSSPAPGIFQGPGAITQIATVASETYHFAGLYNDSLVIRDASGSEQQLGFIASSQTVLFFTNVTGTPAAYTVNVSGNATSIAVGKAINFTAFSSYASTYPAGFRATSFTYKWNFGDGGTATTTGNVTSVVHTYASAGSFTVKVVATEQGTTCCPTHITENGFLPVTVTGGAFTVSISGPATGTVGTAVSFTATTSGGTAPFSFSWNFGDGTGNVATGTTNTASHTYTVKGTYTVKVNATDSTGKIASTSTSITIAPLTLAVTVSGPTSGTVGTLVTFTASPSGGTSPYTFSWNFGDGTGNVATGTTASASHTYTVKGTYPVKVNATDANGKLASASTSITIAPLPLTVTVSGPTSGTVGTAVTFTASPSGGTAPYTFSWNFGDGTGNVATGTTNTASHTYTVKGTYTVKVNATDANGKLASASASITIAPLPLAVTVSGPTSGTVGTAVTFTASPSGGTSPYTFSWNFGDGTGNFAIGTTNTASHTYTSPGTFTVKVNATDANGKLATASTGITIKSVLIVDFGPTTTIVGNTTFVSQISGGTAPFTCTWNFGDGTPVATGCNPFHVYIASGSFSATLTVTDSTGATGSMTHTVTVESNPRFIHGKLSWKHHMSVNTVQQFNAKIGNPTTFTVTVTVTIDIFTDTGVFVTRLTASTTLAPGTINTNFAPCPGLCFTPTAVAKYHFTATVTYSATIPTGLSSGPATTTVTGSDGSKGGSFAAV